MTIRPVPKVIEYAPDSAPSPVDGMSLTGEDRDHGGLVLEQLGAGRAGGQQLELHLARSQDWSLGRDPVTGHTHEEGYRITAEAAGSRAILEYRSLRGLRYGLTTVAALIATGSWQSGLRIEDSPRFPIRGVIEGYYGPPWPPEKRRELLALMSRHKMNSYFYGPKDDDYHRTQWRELYPTEKLAELRSVIELTGTLDMDFWYTIGPGLSMSYADSSDRTDLRKKVDQILELGVRKIGLLFDDIPETLQHKADADAFPSLASAHAFVANELFTAIRDELPSLAFAVCPTVYHGAGTESYISELGSLLDPRIEMFWTGPEICSRELTLRDAALLERTISRPVLYWDNYPVNDCEMIHELHIGPYRGRDPHLYRAAVGVVANGMEHAESSKIGLLTVADYLWNPEAYDPEASWDYALQTVVGEQEWREFKAFADNCRYSALYPSDSPYLSAQLQRANFLLQTEGPEAAAAVMTETLARLHSALELFDRGMENKDLEAEIQPWVRKYRTGVALLEAKSAAVAAGSQSSHELRALAREFAEDRTYVFADVLNPLLEV